MTIYLFDFDNTIVKLPYKESINYMDTDDSLNTKLGFTIIEDTKTDYKKAVKRNDGPIFLLSNRVSAVRKALEETLNVFGYKFDDYFLIDSEDRNKGNRVKQILDNHPKCEKVIYWEDKDKHIRSVTEVIKNYPNVELVVKKTI